MVSWSKCSNIFPQIESSETGRWFWIACLSPFLWIGTTLTFFHSSGNLPFRRHVLKIKSWGLQIESPQSFNIRMLIIWPCALFESRFLIIRRMSFLEKWQLAHESSVSKVNCGGDTLLLDMTEHCSPKKVLRISLFSLKSTVYFLLWNIGGIHIFLSFSKVFNKDQ